MILVPLYWSKACITYIMMSACITYIMMSALLEACITYIMMSALLEVCITYIMISALLAQTDVGKTHRERESERKRKPQKEC